MTKGLRRGLSSYGDPEFSLYLRKAFIKAAGYGDDALERPIVGVADTSSDFNPCHGNAPALVEAVRRGVHLHGGLAMRFPTISLHESFAHPTSMYLRNLMAMDTEEMLRGLPIDAAILIGGCDKTLPAQIMAAASVDCPSIVLPVGPMLTGSHRGERLGACTDCRRLWAEFRAGQRSAQEIDEITDSLAPTAGTCTVMGTASTMACLAETLGIALSGSGTAPAVHADRLRIAERTGAQAVSLARANGPTVGQLLTKSALRNAIVALQAIGGSTNAVIHLAAIAGRCGLDFDLNEVDAIGREVPMLLDLKPSGSGYMEDFHRAGGMPRVLRELTDHIDGSVQTVTGATLGETYAPAVPDWPQSFIRPTDRPVRAAEALVILRGNLAPRGAVLKAAAASADLLVHEGRAVVFDSVEDLVTTIDAETRATRASDVLVLRNAGPRGGPGMPEAGHIPIPRALASAGVRDMVRVSDARISGTAFGTVVAHVTPEAAAGGPLAAVHDGDVIRLDVPARRLDVLIGDQELRRRLAEARTTPSRPERGYNLLYRTSVLQADQGCDFEFLRRRPRAGALTD
jgi:dihydroxy-acid dehydratase